MTALEEIAIDKLIKELNSIATRSHENNASRIEHEQIFIHCAALRAIKIVEAIKSHQ